MEASSVCSLRGMDSGAQRGAGEAAQGRGEGERRGRRGERGWRSPTKVEDEAGAASCSWAPTQEAGIATSSFLGAQNAFIWEARPDLAEDRFH